MKKHTRLPTDTKNIDIDTTLPVAKRILAFVQQGGDPYSMCVGDINVRIMFSDNAPSLQTCMEHLCDILQ